MPIFYLVQLTLGIDFLIKWVIIKIVFATIVNGKQLKEMEILKFLIFNVLFC